MGNEPLKIQEIISPCCGAEPYYDSEMQEDERKQIHHSPQTQTNITKSQPIIIKTEYNSTSVSLHEKHIIDEKDPNYILMKSFHRSVSNSSISKIHSRKMTSISLYKHLSTDTSFSNEASVLWKIMTDERRQFSTSHDIDTNLTVTDFQMIQMPKPPLLNIYMDDIIYYKSMQTGDDLVIGASAYMHIMKSEYKQGIYTYNLNTFAYEMLCELPEILSNYQTYLAFDHEYERLHFLFGDGNIWMKYDIKQNLWYIMCTPEDVSIKNQYHIEKLMKAKCLVIDHIPHVVGQGSHFIFDKEVDRFVKYPLTTRDELDPKNLVYVQAMKRCYIFGGHNGMQQNAFVALGAAQMSLKISNDIWYLDVCDIDDGIIWNLYELKLPYKMNKLDYHTVVCYEYLVFIFYHTSNEVWCMDLKHDYLVKAEKLCLVPLGQFTQMIATNNNVIHAICLDSFGPTHMRINAESLIPREIFDLYSRSCADLICGYIKQHYQHKIPFKIKQHIFEHYPVFL